MSPVTSGTAVPAAATLSLGALSDDDIRAGVQAALDRQVAARSRADRDAYMATIDQRNLTWRRIQGDAFSAQTAGGARAAGAHTATQLVRKELGYVKVWLDIASAGGGTATSRAVWVFRSGEAGWLHSEPLADELGYRKRRESEHVTLAYFGWDDDVIERIGGVADAAHTQVLERTGMSPNARATVSVNPTYASHSQLRGYGTWALYVPSTDQILIRSIESYGAGTTAPGETQEARLLVALTHEYAHLVNNHLIPTARMPKWMVEGFAEYVAENLRSGSLVGALRSGRSHTLDRASEIIEWGNDPSRGFTNADVDLAYAHAAHATAFFMQQYGRERFFALATDFAETRRWEDSFTRATGSAWSDFERSWLEWAKRRYGV